MQLTLATLSSLLTVHLTASTSFVTRKDSGVLSSEYTPVNEKGKAAPPKRVMYYVCLFPPYTTWSSILTCTPGGGLWYSRDQDNPVWFRHPRLSRWSYTIHQGPWSCSLRSIWVVARQGGSFRTHCKLHRKYCEQILREVRDERRCVTSPSICVSQK